MWQARQGRRASLITFRRGPVRPIAAAFSLTFALTFSLTVAEFAAAQTETVLYSFTNLASTGTSPQSGLVADSSGALYGTLRSGGEFGAGTVFKLSPPTSKRKSWAETTLYSFTGGLDGNTPADAGRLVLDKAGNIFGTTGFGGLNSHGVAFELSPGAGGVWTEKVLYNFGTTATDAEIPFLGLISNAGVFYGAAGEGGQFGAGAVFKLSQSGSTWIETVVYSFTGGSDGGSPSSSPSFHSGNLYGTTGSGGANSCGVVYELSPPQNGSTSWSETVLHSFTCLADGAYPLGGVVLDKSGNVYGTTQAGGLLPYGVVFELAAPSWTETVLYNFADGSDGEFPQASLVFDSAGNLYGTTTGSGSTGGNQGSVFELRPPTSSAAPWTETTLHSFTGGSDGGTPLAPLLLRGGVLYGTTYEGGSNTSVNGGLVFKLKP
jgi:uncharacterized repeat protein (TIGR03803 family)